MGIFLQAGMVLLATATCAAQTADRSAVPPNPSTAAPPAHTAYTVQNGELIVAPGLKIPNGNVPWALDEVGGKQVLVPIHHAALQMKGDSATIQGGPSSHTPLHSSSASFFVHTSDRTENTGDAGRGVPTGWALVKPTVEGDSRTVAHVKFSDVNGATVCAPPVLCAAAESLPDGWIRITPRQPLEAGEYVLVPVKRASVEPTVVYDFNVDAQSAPAKDSVAPGQNLDIAPSKKKKH